MNEDNRKIVMARIAGSQEHRVTMIGHLRRILGRRMPRNRAGTPVISDFDLLLATDAELDEAIRHTLV